jgi:5-methylcytosine-specific restriction endonuclease McrA
MLPPAAHRPLVAPLAPDRYLLRITISDETRQKLDRARDLLRHSMPTGDPATIVDRALTVLLVQLEKQKFARASRPKRPRTGPRSRSRHVPAAVKRDVWTRDEGRCAFVGTGGRCQETGFLEIHHVRPFAVGGAADAQNLELRCRAHHAHEVTLYFGEKVTELPAG